MSYLYTRVTSFILNLTVYPASHNAPMETSQCFMLGEICPCLPIVGNIGKYNSLSIAYLIIWPLGNFSWIIFVVGRTLFRWAYTVMRIHVHPESETAKFSSFVYCINFFVDDW